MGPRRRFSCLNFANRGSPNREARRFLELCHGGVLLLSPARRAHALAKDPAPANDRCDCLMFWSWKVASPCHDAMLRCSRHVRIVQSNAIPKACVRIGWDGNGVWMGLCGICVGAVWDLSEERGSVLGWGWGHPVSAVAAMSACWCFVLRRWPFVGPPNRAWHCDPTVKSVACSCAVLPIHTHTHTHTHPPSKRQLSHGGHL